MELEYSSKHLQPHWNLIFYHITESLKENCAALVKNVLIQHLHLPGDIVHSMKFCDAHRLGKQNASKTRPLVVRFTCRSDRELVWKNRFHSKDSSIAIGEDFPKHIQDIRKKVSMIFAISTWYSVTVSEMRAPS